MNADDYLSRALAYERKMMFDEVISCYQEAICVHPDHFVAHARLSFALYNRRRLNEAEASLKHALRLNPYYGEAYCCLGMIYRERELFDDALACFQRALEINPESPWFLTNFGVTLQFSGRREEGRVYLHKALEKNRVIQNAQGSFDELLAHAGENSRETAPARERSPKRILIVVSAYNRKKITALALRQIRRFMTPDCRLHVYNDHSSEYDSSFLSFYADDVTRLPEKMGIDKLRWFQLRAFLETDFEYLYLTDNDVIHDPDYLTVFDRLYEMEKRRMPVSLFHNIFMLQTRLLLYYRNGIFIKTSAPGASMFLDRKMVETVVSVSRGMGDRSSPISPVKRRRLGIMQ